MFEGKPVHPQASPCSIGPTRIQTPANEQIVDIIYILDGSGFTLFRQFVL